MALHDGAGNQAIPENSSAEPSQVRPPPRATELPTGTESGTLPDVAPPGEAQMPKALSDRAIAMTGLVGISLEIGAGKPATLTINSTDILRNQGLMLVGATARLMGLGFAPLPVNATQPYVGAPITIRLADALSALGGGDAASLVGGVPLFLEVTTTDTAGQTHVTRTPFEVTDRDLQADATAILEPPPLAPSLTP